MKTIRRALEQPPMPVSFLCRLGKAPSAERAYCHMIKQPATLRLCLCLCLCLCLSLAGERVIHSRAHLRKKLYAHLAHERPPARHLLARACGRRGNARNGAGRPPPRFVSVVAVFPVSFDENQVLNDDDDQVL